MNHCKICFQEIKQLGINSLNKKVTICQNCYNKFDVLFYEYKIEKYHVLSIYNYDDVMTKLIFQYKACFDIELKSVFLERHINELRLKYSNYVIVPIPSSKESDEERGFNHVEELFAELKLPIYKCLEKKFNFKQSDLSKNERMKVESKLLIKKGELLKNKNVLLVDDIITTGSSLKAGINLIKKYNPKRIECLTLCKKC